MGFFITELLRKEDKQELKRRFMPPDYHFPKIKRGQIVIPEEVLKQIAQEEFDYHDRLMRKIPVAKG
jgi:hypothetical protein